MSIIHAAKSEPDQRLWRYMDLGKFILLLHTRTLWFSKAAEFKDDPYEGFCVVEHNVVSEAQPGAEQLKACMASDSAIDLRDAPRLLFVNCWSLGPESNLMWEAYSSNSRLSVAVVSSTHRYVDAVDWSNLKQRDVHCGPVVYGPIETSPFHDLRVEIPWGDELIRRLVALGLYKRDFFRGENEWRAVVHQDAASAPGVTTGVDLNRLIIEIRLHPKAEAYFESAVRAVVDQFCPGKPVLRSDILNEPPQRYPT